MISDLPAFINSLKFVRVLKQDNLSKTIFCLFNHNEENAILIMQKCNITSEDVQGMVSFESNKFTNQISNDIYHRFQLFTTPECSGVSSTLIYPATSLHIEKYSQPPNFVLVRETTEDYKNSVLPYLRGKQFDLSWVYNLLAEDVEKVIYRDRDPENGFVMVPDLKWNQKDLSQLYALVLCNKTDIMSIRDLRGSHLGLLRNIYSRGLEELEREYGVEKTSFRVYVHYQPTFYHFHVHFVNLTSGFMGYPVGKAHLLEDVIDNLEDDSDFYWRRALSYVLPSDSPLLLEILANRESLGC